MARIFSMSDTVVFLVWILLHNAVLVYSGETCGPPGDQVFCDNGCCDSSGNNSKDTCCSVSTSVLVVACVVSGLVLIAMIASIIICCYKNYKDKQASRVRRIQQEQAMNEPRVRGGVEPRKPPEYISAPPAYSVEMPESHYRPQTVTGHVNQSYNQRFRGVTPVPARGNISTTRTSGRHPVTTSESMRNPQIPGAVPIEAPPPYSQYARGQTPANRRQRFITTPLPEESNNTNTQTTQGVSNSQSTNETLLTITAGEHTRVRRQNNFQPQPILESNSPLSSTTDSSDSSSRAVSTRAESRVEESRAQESRVESRAESRSQTVARVLGSRAPSRVAQSRAAHSRAAHSRDTERTNQNNPFILIGGGNASVAPSTNTDSSIHGTNSQTSARNNDIVEDLSIV